MAYLFPFPNQVFQVSGIDATVVNTTVKIFTVPAGVRFYPQFLMFECTSTTGFAVVPSVSVGIAASYNEILGISALTGVSSANKVLSFSITNLTQSFDATKDITVKITTAATATTYLLRAVAIGALI